MSAPMDPDELAEVRSLVSATLSSKLGRLLADRDLWEKQTKELLAVIHGDGGHHSDLVGIAQSLADAHDALPTLRAQLTESNRERDEARRTVCEKHAAFYTKREDEEQATRAKAASRGWGYLYPEESDQ